MTTTDFFCFLLSLFFFLSIASENIISSLRDSNRSIHGSTVNHVLYYNTNSYTVHYILYISTVYDIQNARNQPCNNDKIAKLKSATDFISFSAANEHFSARCNTLAYFLDDVSCGRNNLICVQFQSKDSGQSHVLDQQLSPGQTRLGTGCEPILCKAFKITETRSTDFF